MSSKILFTKEEIGSRKKMKGSFGIMSCHNPFDFISRASCIDNPMNIKSLLDIRLEIDDDECLVDSEKTFISPKSFKKYGQMIRFCAPNV